MIKVTRLNGRELVINAELIVTLEKTPDTVITLIGDKRFLVKESTDQIIEQIVAYRGALLGKIPFYSGKGK